MTSRNARNRSKGGKVHSFVQFPHYMLKHPSFQALSGRACKVLLYLAAQYKGNNNGDLQATYTLAKSAGLRSAANLRAGTVELEEAGFIVKTRQGGRNSCSLYALTWFPIDDCKGKLLTIAPTNVATNAWRRGTLSTPSAVQLKPQAVQSTKSGDLSEVPLNHPRPSQPISSVFIEPPADTFLVIPGRGANSDVTPAPRLSAPKYLGRREARPKSKRIPTTSTPITSPVRAEGKQA